MAAPELLAHHGGQEGVREKNVDFEFRHIEPDNRPDWFLAISPHKKVPVLRVNGNLSDWTIL